MSENALSVVQNGVNLPANVKEFRGNYQISLYNGQSFTLTRGVDFGKPNAKLKQPILLKAGAEKIRYEYGVFDRYTPIDKIVDVENGFFSFTFKCELVRYENGEAFVVAEGYGAANTREGNTGQASGFDTMNTKLKIAEKRSLIDAVIKLARLSSIFTQDIENDTFMEAAVQLKEAKDNDYVTTKQIQRLFAIAGTNGMNRDQAKMWLTAHGVTSVKTVTQAQYAVLCDELEKEGEGHASETE